MAIIYLPHFKYTQNTEHTRYIKLVCFTWKNNSWSVLLNVSAFLARRMPKQYSISRHVFSSIWGVTEAITLLILSQSSPILPNLEVIPGLLHSSQRRNPVGLHRGREGTRGLVRPAQSICLENSLTVMPSVEGHHLVDRKHLVENVGEGRGPGD
jgi:hypothetical protein